MTKRLLFFPEVGRLLSKDLIEQSNLPWRAQSFVITTENHQQRL